jgi:hypothetical protein
LYEVLHLNNEAGGALDEFTKRAMMISLARIMNTFHSQMESIFHGHLSSHNIFVEYPDNEEASTLEWSELQ